jgi:hypothetical protein
MVVYCLKAQILIKQLSSVFTRGSVNNMPETHINLKSTIPSITIKTEGLEKLLININPSNTNKIHNEKFNYMCILNFGVI